MCTLSWRTGPQGYEVYFNRDELRTRPRARSPTLRVSDTACASGRARYLAPTDPGGGGTWILVNQTGLTLCLLNGYLEPAVDGTDDFRSRGLLVTDLAACRDQDEVAEGATRLVAAARYRSFSLVAFCPGTEPRAWGWSGADGELGPLEVEAPMSSSSLDPEASQRLRRSLRASQPEPDAEEALLALHRAHEGGPRELTPCMHRRDAHTVSLTRVRVTADTASMEYAPGPPCSTPLGAPVFLELAR